MAYAKDKEQIVVLKLYLTEEENDDLLSFCNSQGWSVSGMIKQSLFQLQRKMSQTTKQKVSDELPLTILN
ncbi:TPA: hypothetical protein ACRFDF_001466 [Yersinia enterocolitica]|nr:hypothetical protein [Yersinia enterocolitica]HDL6595937.1 hypothetical protein [Yersinia enterocolitica]HDZ9578915.1 hypothetical protein [Yersinia enterocolitica]HEB5885678.1 hypothetical protein [Yersinia enterocolitica]